MITTDTQDTTNSEKTVLCAHLLTLPHLTPREVGIAGENFAAAILTDDGYKVITQNFRTRFGELDIIATTPEKDTIAVVEVKTRRSHHYGPPQEAVTPIKQARLRRAALEWLQQNSTYGIPLRFDVFSIIPQHRHILFHHLKGAF